MLGSTRTNIYLNMRGIFTRWHLHPFSRFLVTCPWCKSQYRSCWVHPHSAKLWFLHECTWCRFNRLSKVWLRFLIFISIYLGFGRLKFASFQKFKLRASIIPMLLIIADSETGLCTAPVGIFWGKRAARRKWLYINLHRSEIVFVKFNSKYFILDTIFQQMIWTCRNWNKFVHMHTSCHLPT